MLLNKTPKSFHRIPPRGHDSLATSYTVNSPCSFILQSIFGAVAGEGTMYLFFNKFGVLFQGLEDSNLFKLCKRRLTNSVPLLSKVGNKISRNCVAKVENFIGLLKLFFAGRIARKEKNFVCYILAISIIHHPCFNPTVI